jgi:LysM repeat protein
MSRKKQTGFIVAVLCLISGLAKADNDYMVEKGDSLIKIGKLFGVPYKEIMRVNNLESTTIYTDQILRIPAGGRTTDRDIAAAAYEAELQNTPSPEPVLASANVENRSYSAPTRAENPSYSQTAYIPPVQGASKARPTAPREPETYTVREGDTLWSIGRRFGVAPADLKKLNNIELSNIQIGQVLTIPAHVSIAAN